MFPIPLIVNCNYLVIMSEVLESFYGTSEQNTESEILIIFFLHANCSHFIIRPTRNSWEVKFQNS